MKKNVVLLGSEDLIEEPLHISDLDNKKTNHWAIEVWPDGESYLTGFAYGSG